MKKNSTPVDIFEKHAMGAVIYSGKSFSCNPFSYPKASGESCTGPIRSNRRTTSLLQKLSLEQDCISMFGYSTPVQPWNGETIKQHFKWNVRMEISRVETCRCFLSRVYIMCFDVLCEKVSPWRLCWCSFHPSQEFSMRTQISALQSAQLFVQIKVRKGTVPMLCW